MDIKFLQAESSQLTNAKQLKESESLEMSNLRVKITSQSSCRYDGDTETNTVGRSILATFIAALGPLSYGFCMGYSSPALEDLQNADKPSDVQLSSEQGSWFSSSIAFGAIVGCSVGGPAMERFGRKFVTMLCAIPFVLGWLLISYAKDVEMLYAGRILTGIGCGVISCTSPVYIAEIAAARVRGALGSVRGPALTFGALLAYAMGILFHWRWLAFIGAVPPALLLILMIPLPDSPRWLLGKNFDNEAMDALLWLRGPHADVQGECSTVKANLDRHEKFTLADLKTSAMVKPFIISVGLLMLQQLSGFNSVLFNAADIFKTAGFSEEKLVSFIIVFAQLIGKIAACFLVDRIGRRILLLTASFGMTMSLLALGVYFQIYIPPSDPNTCNGTASPLHSCIVSAYEISWLSILSVVVFGLTFSFAWGPMPWLIISEVFPLRARGLACSFASMIFWTTLFTVTKSYHYLSVALTIQGVYWLYASFCFLGFVFVYILLPETKGKTLEEIEAIFEGEKNQYERIP